MINAKIHLGACANQSLKELRLPLVSWTRKYEWTKNIGFIREILIYHQLFYRSSLKTKPWNIFFIFTFDSSNTSLAFSYIYFYFRYMSVELLIQRTSMTYITGDKVTSQSDLQRSNSFGVSKVWYVMLFYGINMSYKRVCKRAGLYALIMSVL